VQVGGGIIALFRAAGTARSLLPLRTIMHGLQPDVT